MNFRRLEKFLRGFVHEISIDPDTARGVITFYELPMKCREAQAGLQPNVRPYSIPKGGHAWRNRILQILIVCAPLAARLTVPRNDHCSKD